MKLEVKVEIQPKAPNSRPCTSNFVGRDLVTAGQIICAWQIDALFSLPVWSGWLVSFSDRTVGSRIHILSLVGVISPYRLSGGDESVVSGCPCTTWQVASTVVIHNLCHTVNNFCVFLIFKTVSYFYLHLYHTGEIFFYADLHRSRWKKPLSSLYCQSQTSTMWRSYADSLKVTDTAWTLEKPALAIYLRKQSLWGKSPENWMLPEAQPVTIGRSITWRQQFLETPPPTALWPVENDWWTFLKMCSPSVLVTSYPSSNQKSCKTKPMFLQFSVIPPKPQCGFVNYQRQKENTTIKEVKLSVFHS